MIYHDSSCKYIHDLYLSYNPHAVKTIWHNYRWLGYPDEYSLLLYKNIYERYSWEALAYNEYP